MVLRRPVAQYANTPPCVFNTASVCVRTSSGEKLVIVTGLYSNAIPAWVTAMRMCSLCSSLGASLSGRLQITFANPSCGNRFTDSNLSTPVTWYLGVIL